MDRETTFALLRLLFEAKKGNCSIPNWKSVTEEEERTDTALYLYWCNFFKIKVDIRKIIWRSKIALEEKNLTPWTSAPGGIWINFKIEESSLKYLSRIDSDQVTVEINCRVFKQIFETCSRKYVSHRNQSCQERPPQSWVLTQGLSFYT